MILLRNIELYKSHNRITVSSISILLVKIFFNDRKIYGSLNTIEKLL